MLLFLFRGTLPNYASQMAGMSSRIGSGIPGTSGGVPVGNPAVGASAGLVGTNHVVPNLQSMRRSSPNSSSQYRSFDMRLF